MATYQHQQGREAHPSQDDSGGRPCPAAKFQVTFVLNEFPITAEFTGHAAQLRQMTERLHALGATPPSVATPQAQPVVPTPARSSEEVPQCRYHGAMKKAP